MAWVRPFGVPGQQVNPMGVDERRGSSTEVDGVRGLRECGHSDGQFVMDCLNHLRDALQMRGKMKIAVMASRSAKWNVNVNPRHAVKFGGKSQ